MLRGRGLDGVLWARQIGHKENCQGLGTDYKVFPSQEEGSEGGLGGELSGSLGGSSAYRQGSGCGCCRLGIQWS